MVRGWSARRSRWPDGACSDGGGQSGRPLCSTGQGRVVCFCRWQRGDDDGDGSDDDVDGYGDGVDGKRKGWGEDLEEKVARVPGEGIIFGAVGLGGLILIFAVGSRWARRGEGVGVGASASERCGAQSQAGSRQSLWHGQLSR